jgi:hypothetical protein
MVRDERLHAAIVNDGWRTEYPESAMLTSSF